MFKNYKEEGYISNIKKQHNIMVFIGNGFDIAVLKNYRSDNLVSSYSKFYDFLCYRGFDIDNVLFKKIEADRCVGKENWCDFECSLDKLLQNNISTEKLNEALSEMQSMFLLFLNEIVTPEILVRLNNDAAINKWGMKALSSFLGDLDKEEYEKMNFPEKTNHYHMYNYLFVNFNYTSLFDNYIYLDKDQFEPHPYKTVDTNFKFYPNPKGYMRKGADSKTTWSSFVMTDTIHPHGYQNIPRSLLFGTENENYISDRDLNRFNKSYWAQNNQKYRSYFDEAHLFIIYGTSMGETDSWWWKNIYKSISQGNSELIIYYYSSIHYSKDDVKQMFIGACKVDASEKEIAKVKEKIYVVLYNDNSELNMFGLKNRDTERPLISK